LTWNASDTADWLSLSPTSGNSAGEIDNITLSVNIAGLDAGNYAAIVTIYAIEATNSPQTIAVNLTVNQAVDEEEREKEVEEEEIIDALNTAKLLDIGYNSPEQIVTVEGIIVRTFYAKESKGQPTFLDFHDPYEGYLICIIWKEHKQTGEPIRAMFMKAFSPNPETFLLNKKVRVKGKIEIYKGDPEIVLYNPSQIWVVE